MKINRREVLPVKVRTDVNNCMLIQDLENLDGKKISEYRKKLHLSQPAFAKKFDIPLSTLRKWEQKKSVPSTARIGLFKMKILQEGFS